MHYLYTRVLSKKKLLFKFLLEYIELNFFSPANELSDHPNFMGKFLKLQYIHGDGSFEFLILNP